MKKPFLTVFGVISTFLLLTSCLVFKPSPSNYNTQTSISVVSPAEVDTNLYNTYFVTYNNGQTQILQYEYRYNFYRVIDSTKVSNVDTSQYKVLWKDLN
jgi:hypothetical protein